MIRQIVRLLVGGRNSGKSRIAMAMRQMVTPCVFKEAFRHDLDAEKKVAAIAALVDYVESRDFKLIKLTPYDYMSNCGRVKFCDDIYGYEVKCADVPYLIDCNWNRYNLTRDQALEIYGAIVKRFQTYHND